MQSSRVVAVLAFAALTAQAAPFIRTRTYFVTGVKDTADVEAITIAVSKLPTVRKVVGLTPKSGAVTVTFDPHVVSHGEVGYAIMAAKPGRDYTVRVRFRVPEYAEGGNAKAVDAILKEQASLIEVTTLDRQQGLFEGKLLPFTRAPKAAEGPQGFRFGSLMHPIHEPPPKGLGLGFEFIGADGKPDPFAEP